MSDVESVESDGFLAYQIGRQRTAMFEAVELYEERQRGLLSEIQALTRELEIERTRARELRAAGEEEHAVNDALNAANEELRAIIEKILSSKSWRVMEPFRFALALIRRRKRS